MGRLLSLAVTGAFTITLLIAGSAGAVVCDPHCAPPKANTGGETKGLNRANAVAGDHGQHGRDNAAAKQDLHKPGGSGVVLQTPAPVPPAPVPAAPVTPPPVVPAPEPCVGC
jgi:hypothetical protein